MSDHGWLKLDGSRGSYVEYKPGEGYCHVGWIFVPKNERGSGHAKEMIIQLLSTYAIVYASSPTDHGFWDHIKEEFKGRVETQS
ncbi:MAG: hypothetical protein WCK98_06860 [bacterium]